MTYVNNRAKQIVAFQRKLYREKRDFYKRLLTLAWDRSHRNPNKANLTAMNNRLEELQSYVDKRKKKKTANRLREMFNEHELPTKRLTKSFTTRAKLIMNPRRRKYRSSTPNYTRPKNLRTLRLWMISCQTQ